MGCDPITGYTERPELAGNRSGKADHRAFGRAIDKNCTIVAILSRYGGDINDSPVPLFFHNGSDRADRPKDPFNIYIQGSVDNVVRSLLYLSRDEESCIVDQYIYPSNSRCVPVMRSSTC